MANIEAQLESKNGIATSSEWAVVVHTLLWAAFALVLSLIAPPFLWQLETSDTPLSSVSQFALIASQSLSKFWHLVLPVFATSMFMEWLLLRMTNRAARNWLHTSLMILLGIIPLSLTIASGSSLLLALKD